MLPLSRMPIRIAVTALSLVAMAAQAQTGVPGRKLFEAKNCSQCHAYEARSFGPSVRNMKVKLKGDPAATSAAILAAADHALDLKSLSPENIRAISEWLAATTFEEQAAAAAKPPPNSAAAKREAAAKAKREAQAKAKQEADAKAQTKKDAAAKAKQAADGKAQAKRDAEAQAKREAVAKQANAELAKREADAKARKDTGALEAIKRESDERARRDAEAQAAAKRDADARMNREAEERAKLEGEAKAKKDAEALAAKKREAETQAQAKKPDATTKAVPAAPAGKKTIAYRDGSDLPPCAAPTGAALGTINEAGAKAIIERIGCPQCHAYVQKKVGPPMKQIQEKYKGNWECVVQRLQTTKTHKEEGVTDDLKGNEFKIVGDYIATRNK